MGVSVGIGLLAPVPAIFLHSAIEVCGEQGAVAFGTSAFEVFAKLDQDYGQGLPVLIYPTVRHGAPKGICDPGFVNFRATYLWAVEAVRGKHPTPALRPTPTIDDGAPDSAWPMFWEVSDLVQSAPSERVPLTTLKAMGKNKPLPLGFVPHGPMLVAAPFL